MRCLIERTRDISAPTVRISDPRFSSAITCAADSAAVACCASPGACGAQDGSLGCRTILSASMHHCFRLAGCAGATKSTGPVGSDLRSAPHHQTLRHEASTEQASTLRCPTRTATCWGSSQEEAGSPLPNLARCAANCSNSPATLPIRALADAQLLLQATRLSRPCAQPLERITQKNGTFPDVDGGIPKHCLLTARRATAHRTPDTPWRGDVRPRSLTRLAASATRARQRHERALDSVQLRARTHSPFRHRQVCWSGERPGYRTTPSMPPHFGTAPQAAPTRGVLAESCAPFWGR